MPNHRPEAIANEFLRRAGSNGLTQMQLQKLVYIAHGWTLAIRNEPLVNARLEAWERGPVYPELAKNIAHAGAEPIREKMIMTRLHFYLKMTEVSFLKLD